MATDSALDQLAFAMGYRLMDPSERLALRIDLLRQVPSRQRPPGMLERLEDEQSLRLGERAPASLYDRCVLHRAAREEAEAPFDESFWAMRRRDLEAAGFEPSDASRVITATRDAIGDKKGIVDELSEAA